jgi:predicted phosphate transport protein (TIGR00153 family)
VPRLRLVPQNTEFFDLFSRASSNTVEISRALVAFLDGFPEEGGPHLRTIEELEHEGDRVTHDVIDLLNRTFVTPFDREDIFRLATALDDVCDFVDEVAGNVVGYGVGRVRPPAKAQADVILRSTGKLDEVVGKLNGFKDSRRQLVELRELEDEGDRLVRDAVAELFSSESDPIAVIRWKDLYEGLEEAVDACENAADVLEGIFVKNR